MYCCLETSALANQPDSFVTQYMKVFFDQVTDKPNIPRLNLNTKRFSSKLYLTVSST